MVAEYKTAYGVPKLGHFSTVEIKIWERIFLEFGMMKS